MTGGLVLVGAGLKQFGIEKNLQVVLHSQVIGNTPTQPEVVAFHVW